MKDDSQNLICRHIFSIQELMDLYPPKLRNARKKIVHRIACPSGCSSSGELVFSRWHSLALPQILTSEHQTQIEERESYFQYEPSDDRDRVEWYLNFAHSDLFCAYGGALLAQDEMQVAEHPVLASLREALLDKEITPFTVESGEPTPIAIRGAERRCIIDTDPDPDKGRPYGLYGNNFARAKAEAIEQAVRPLNPPTITNIIAMEAPPGGYGLYQKEEIEYILSTAFTGFSAANFESKLGNPAALAIVHTGFWGCGAYGGNRVLMALLQLLAANLSQIERLVFHAGASAGNLALTEARQILGKYLTPHASEVKVSALIDEICGMGFEWGVSDGN